MDKIQPALNLEKIREVLKQKGFKRKDLEKVIFLTSGRIHQLIKLNRMSQDRLQQIADFLEVPIETFYADNTD